MRRLVIVLVVFALVPPFAVGRMGAPSPESAPRRLAVILVVDGLSWERLNTVRPWFTGGLARLLDEGAVATECRYEHLDTETGPGHASIATGAPPRVHGIPLNAWYAPSPDGTKMEDIYSASQPEAGEPETSAKTIPGPGRLRVATLGDRMLARDPRARVVAISNKDRAAILLAGRDARNAAYWYSSKDGTYVTSAAYDQKSPTGASAARIVARFNKDVVGPEIAPRTIWSRLPLPEHPPAAGFESDLTPYQDTVVGPTFPHDLAASKRPLISALLWSPVADRLLTDLALALLADDELGLGRDDVPDLLAVSYSANDYVSHFYGPESLEDLELLRALDLEIGRLLDGLTARLGKDSVLVALSADHGLLPLPESTKRKNPASHGLRVQDTDILTDLNRAVDAELGRKEAKPLVYRLEGESLWLDRSAMRAPGAPGAKRLLEIVRRELSTRWKDAIETTILTNEVSSHARDDIGRLAWNACVPGRSGELLVVPRFGVLIDPYGGKGSMHGSPWEYDTHVPLIFWGGGTRAEQRSSPAAPYDIAPTLASWLHVKLPHATGRCIDLWK